MNLLSTSEEGLSHIQSGLADVEIVTPTSSTCEGVTLDTSNLVVVSIIRAGDAMLESFLQICPEAAVGKILIQRDEETALPKLFYYKVPDLTGKQVILVDPMLATGGSAKAAIKILLDKGAPQNRIAFFNVIGCPEGVKALNEAYPGVQIITGHIDHGLNERVRSIILPSITNISTNSLICIGLYYSWVGRLWRSLLRDCIRLTMSTRAGISYDQLVNCSIL